MLKLLSPPAVVCPLLLTLSSRGFVIVIQITTIRAPGLGSVFASARGLLPPRILMLLRLWVLGAGSPLGRAGGADRVSLGPVRQLWLHIVASAVIVNWLVLISASTCGALLSTFVVVRSVCVLLPVALCRGLPIRVPSVGVLSRPPGFLKLSLSLIVLIVVVWGVWLTGRVGRLRLPGHQGLSSVPRPRRRHVLIFVSSVGMCYPRPSFPTIRSRRLAMIGVVVASASL